MDASLWYLQCYSMKAIAEGGFSLDLTAAVFCNSARNRVRARFAGATSGLMCALNPSDPMAGPRQEVIRHRARLRQEARYAEHSLHLAPPASIQTMMSKPMLQAPLQVLAAPIVVVAILLVLVSALRRDEAKGQRHW